MTAEFLHHNVLNPAELPVDITGGSVGMSVTGVSLVAEAFVEEKVVFHRQQDVEDCKLVEIGPKGVSSGRAAKNFDNLFLTKFFEDLIRELDGNMFLAANLFYRQLFPAGQSADSSYCIIGFSRD